MITIEQVFTSVQIQKMLKSQREFVDFLINKANESNMTLSAFKNKVFWYCGFGFKESPAVRINDMKTYQKLKKKGYVQGVDGVGIGGLIAFS